MTKKDYDLAMHYLDKIEEALNEIAIAVGHPTFNEFRTDKYSVRSGSSVG